MKLASELKMIPFPECAKTCSAVKHFGVCECEGLCPWKFDNEGNPIEKIEWRECSNCGAHYVVIHDGSTKCPNCFGRDKKQLRRLRKEGRKKGLI